MACQAVKPPLQRRGRDERNLGMRRSKKKYQKKPPPPSTSYQSEMFFPVLHTMTIYDDPLHPLHHPFSVAKRSICHTQWQAATAFSNPQHPKHLQRTPITSSKVAILRGGELTGSALVQHVETVFPEEFDKAHLRAGGS